MHLEKPTHRLWGGVAHTKTNQFDSVLMYDSLKEKKRVCHLPAQWFCSLNLGYLRCYLRSDKYQKSSA